MDEFEAELQAIQWVIRTDCNRVIYVTQKQVQGLNALLRQGLSSSDRALRIAVVRCLVGAEVMSITGTDITSTKSLTSPIASYLIGQLKEPNSSPWRLSAHGKWLLNEAERHI